MELQEIYKHPMVQELVEQNQLMAEQLEGRTVQHLAHTKKPDSFEPKVVTIKNRLLFQEGMHNGLFYPYEELEKNYELWHNNDLFMAEHEDESPAWIGLSLNPHLVPQERAIYGDLELVDLNAANKISYQIKTHNGRMGVSPTIDVDKQMLSGRMCAMGPYTLKSQSIVLDPAVRTTMFNSKQKNGGDNNMVESETQSLRKDEVAIKREDFEALKESRKELEVFKTKELAKEVEELSAIEMEVGRITEESLSSRKEILAKLSSQERKVLFDTYKWINEELSEKTDEETFINSLPEELKGKIPPGLRKFIEEKKKKKDESEDEKMMKGGMKKGMDDEEKKKKYPYPEAEMHGQRLNEGRENLSRQQQNLITKKSDELNRFQKLSAENAQGNEEFLQFLRANQGGR